MGEYFILFVFMAGWLVVFAISFIKRKNFISGADLVTGIVTSSEQHTERYYEPVVDMQTRERTRFSARKKTIVYTTIVEYIYMGQKYKRTFNFPARVGSRIELYVNREHPARVELKDVRHAHTGLWFRGFVLLLIFLFMIMGFNAFMSMVSPFW